ncbi:MAG TPA: hypothetical protein DDX84_12675 [Nitrospiraceae bacterium]|nr:hypothetical protein [Nitrospiraceae bacterium]HBI25021.1 hypothetical protein [Nitrospiraceae bacterium]
MYQGDIVRTVLNVILQTPAPGHLHIKRKQGVQTATLVADQLLILMIRRNILPHVKIAISQPQPGRSVMAL